MEPVRTQRRIERFQSLFMLLDCFIQFRRFLIYLKVSCDVLIFLYEFYFDVYLRAYANKKYTSI